MFWVYVNQTIIIHKTRIKMNNNDKKMNLKNFIILIILIILVKFLIDGLLIYFGYKPLSNYISDIIKQILSWGEYMKKILYK